MSQITVYSLRGGRDVHEGHIVGLIADTHDNRATSAKAVQVFNERRAGLVIHAGDFVAPFNFREFSKLRARLVGVFGNNDGEQFGLREKFSGIGEIYSAPYEFYYSGKRILLMHDPWSLEALCKSGVYDIIIYGHTHEPEVRKEETLVVNPGECGGWLNGRSTIGVLDLSTMDVEIIELAANL